MSRLLLFALSIYIVSIESCIIHEKGDPDIQVIQLDGSSKESDEEEIVAVHIPDRRRREIDSPASGGLCKADEDCGPGAVCFAHLACVKGTWRVVDARDAAQPRDRTDD